MNFDQAKIIMLSGLPVKRAGWTDFVGAARDRSAGSGVVYKRGRDVWEPSEEDLAAADWTLAVGA